MSRPLLAALVAVSLLSTAVLVRCDRGTQVGVSQEVLQRAGYVEPHTPGWDHGMTIFKWRQSAEELGHDISTPPERALTRIIPDRILYMETWLWKQGYSWKQWWRRDG